MASFISALSLLVLLLATGCFTLPITEEQFSSSTVSSLNDDLTTSQTKENVRHPFDVRVLSDDATTEFPNLHPKRTVTEELNVQTSTSVNKAEFEENASRASRMFEESSTSEPFAFTTQDSLSGLGHQERDYDDLLFTTVESNTEIIDHALRSVESQNEDESDNDKRELQLELTTSYMPSFTSTSSDIAPQLYTSQSSTSTSTKKYTGLLKDETPSEDEESNQVVKPLRKRFPKSKFTTTKKSQIQSEDKSEDDTKESILPIVQLDQEASDKVPNYPDNVLFLEKNTEVVTAMPEKLTTTTMKKIKEQKQEEPDHDQEPESKPKRKPERKPEHDQEPETKPKRKPERKPEPEPEHDQEPEPKPKRKPEPKREPEPEHEDVPELKPKRKPEPEPEPEPELEREPEHEPEHESDEEPPKPKKPLNQGKKPSLPEEKESDH